MCLIHPQTIPDPRSSEKLSSTKLVPGAKTVGDRCPRVFVPEKKTHSSDGTKPLAPGPSPRRCVPACRVQSGLSAGVGSLPQVREMGSVSGRAAYLGMFSSTVAHPYRKTMMPTTEAGMSI